MIHIIAAIDRNGAIGSRGDMLFHIRADLRRFRRLTTGHAVIMGRRTFDSLPGGVLPDRRNIVVTRNPLWAADGAERAESLEHALQMAGGDSDIFIIGGGDIYRQAMPVADVLDITHIDAAGEQADTFFPPIGPEWHVAEKESDTAATPPLTFITYRR